MGRGQRQISAGGLLRAVSNFSEYLPESKREYYNQLNAKHFNPETAVGSVFLDVGSIDSLLKKAGDLERDDREYFIKAGVSSEALLPQCRYLKVETPGKVGIIPIEDCSDDETVEVIRTKEGSPCSLVIKRDSLPETNVATLIIGPDDSPDSKNQIVWTAHPGLPIAPATEDIWPEGSSIKVSDVKEGATWLQVKTN